MDFDAFISHSSKDKTMADAVCAKLEHAGIRCWIAPRDVPAGKTWSGEIIKAIETCKVMVLVFSSNANESPQIVREVEAAVHRSKPILPLRIENIMPSDSMAFFMNSVHWLDAITEPVDAQLDKMVLAVSSLLGVDGPTLKFIPPQEDKKKAPAPFNWTPWAIVAAAVIVALGMAAFLIHDLFSPKNTIVTFPPANPQPGAITPTAPAYVPPSAVVSPAQAAAPNPTPSAGLIDPAMTGTWHFNTTVSKIPAALTLTYNKDGTYTGETVLSDTGTYQSANGQWSATSNSTGLVQQGTYSYAGPHTMKVTGPLGMVFFSPVLPQANLDPNNPVMLGTWQGTSHPANSPPWVFTNTNNPDGTYDDKVEIADHGTYRSANGSIIARSQVLGTTTQGSYTLLDQNSISLTGPLGTATWTRN